MDDKLTFESFEQFQDFSFLLDLDVIYMFTDFFYFSK
jgi:hypothetical protein